MTRREFVSASAALAAVGASAAVSESRDTPELAALREKCRSIGSNYMLNIGPDHLGRIPAPGVAILEGLAASKGGSRPS